MSDEPVQPIKPGFKSSEFLVTIVAQIGALACLIYGMIQKDSSFVLTGMGGLGLGQAVYTTNRTVAKR